ncbi:MAG: ATP-binding protein [Propionibacteriaceae bacterium]
MTGSTLSPGVPGPPRLPMLTLFCGLPGSGKTTLAKQLEAAGHGVRICTDDWQAELGVDHADVAFHERLQPTLYRHSLTLLRHGVDVILEDGLWMREERTQKFSDARAVGARIELHVLDVPLDTLWSRLQQRNDGAVPGAYPMTYAELQRAWSLFEPPTPEELSAVDHHQIHRGDVA